MLRRIIQELEKFLSPEYSIEKDIERVEREVGLSSEALLEYYHNRVKRVVIIGVAAAGVMFLFMFFFITVIFPPPSLEPTWMLFNTVSFVLIVLPIFILVSTIAYGVRRERLVYETLLTKIADPNYAQEVELSEWDKKYQQFKRKIAQ